MSDQNYKSRVERAMAKFYARQEKMLAPKSRKNAKPEKSVERICMQWMRLNGWSVDIFEAKATYDPRTRRYRQQAMRAGVCDCMGNLPSGLSVAIEFKAPGKLSTFADARNFQQQDFIMRKIDTGVFACVVDSVERLQSIFTRWCDLRNEGDEIGAKDFLLTMLPRKF